MISSAALREKAYEYTLNAEAQRERGDVEAAQRFELAAVVFRELALLAAFDQSEEAA